MAKSEVNLGPVDRWLVTTATTIQSVVRAEDYDALLARVQALEEALKAADEALWDARDMPKRPSGDHPGMLYCDHCEQTFPGLLHPEGSDCSVVGIERAYSTVRSALASQERRS